MVPDGDRRTLSIQVGKQSKSVDLYFVSSDDARLSEIKRALRVWAVARRWFQDSHASDLSSYDKRILDRK
jgi:hypothetical protein